MSTKYQRVLVDPQPGHNGIHAEVFDMGESTEIVRAHRGTECLVSAYLTPGSTGLTTTMILRTGCDVLADPATYLLHHSTL